MHYALFETWIKQHKINLVIVSLFFLYAIAMTWPFAIHPFSTIVAAPYGDVSSGITKFDALKQEGLNPLFDWHIQTIAVPDGVKSNVGVDRVSVISTLFFWIVTNVTSSLFAHGIFIFLGYFLTATITYFFVKSILKSSRAAFIAAFIYSFFPLFISLARAAPIYNHMWLYILPVWAFVRLEHHFSKKKFALAILSVLPALFWTPYYSYHIFLIGLALLVVYLPLIYKRSGINVALKSFLIISISWLLFCALYYVIGMSNDHGEVPQRTLQEAYEQSIQPLMLVLPGSFTWWGHEGYRLLCRLVPRAVDTNLYLGVSVLSLSFVGLVSLSIRSLRSRIPNQIQIFGLFAASIVFFTFAFSLTPTINIFGIDTPTPNYLVVHFVPALRAGQRLEMPMMLGIVMLASIGLYVLFKRIDKRFITFATIAIVAIIGFDLSVKPPQLTSPAPRFLSMEILSRLPKGITAQYINGSLTGDPGQIACQMRLQHHQPIVNFCGLEISYPAHQLQTIHQIALLPFDKQIQELESLRVRYVIVNKNDTSVTSRLKSNKYHNVIEDQNFTVFESSMRY